jgi:hypothetical protein
MVRVHSRLRLEPETGQASVLTTSPSPRAKSITKPIPPSSKIQASKAWSKRRGFVNRVRPHYGFTTGLAATPASTDVLRQPDNGGNRDGRPTIRRRRVASGRASSYKTEWLQAPTPVSPPRRGWGRPQAGSLRHQRRGHDNGGNRDGRPTIRRRRVREDGNDGDPSTGSGQAACATRAGGTTTTATGTVALPYGGGAIPRPFGCAQGGLLASRPTTEYGCAVWGHALGKRSACQFRRRGTFCRTGIFRNRGRRGRECGRDDR